MAPTHEAPQQYKQASRKGKKAWRKNVDVSDVQTGLENVREEIIQGGIIAEKPSEHLFALDTQGSEPIQRAYNKTHKPLKTDQILAQRSAVPAVDSRKRPSNVTDGVLESTAKRRKSNGVSHKEYQRLQNVANGGESALKDIIRNGDNPTHDPWALESKVEKQDPRFNFLPTPQAITMPMTLKEAPISLAEGGSEVPAVSKPKGRASYNPVFEDWDKALVEEGKKELEAEGQRLREAELEQERLTRIEQAQKEEVDWQTEDESAWEGIESEYEGEEWLRKRRPERKTPVERNKVKKRKEAERQAKQAAGMKKRAQQAERIKEITKEISRKGRANAVIPKEEEITAENDRDVTLRRRKLGKSSVPDAPLELVLPDELRDSLRLLKPEGNLLKDRFRNILLRGKIETRKPISQPKKPRRSTTEKWSYKDWTKDFKVAA